jgi:hypothetical protein
MASFEERIYELGTEALAEQERQVVETRGRGTAIIAAGAVIASLLAKPVFHTGRSGSNESPSSRLWTSRLRKPSRSAARRTGRPSNASRCS